MTDHPHILILAAVRFEVEPLLRRLRWPVNDSTAQGQYQGKTLSIRVTGLGGPRMIKCLAATLDTQPVTHILHVGLSGGLNPQWPSGRLLHVRHVIDEQKNGIDLPPFPITQNNTADDADTTNRTLLTCDRVLDSVQAKADAFDTYQADAVDMETYHVAVYLREHHPRLPYAAIRAIADTHEDALPEQSCQWVREDGSINVSAATNFALTHPQWIPRLMKLQSKSKAAAENLATRILECVEQNG